MTQHHKRNHKKHNIQQSEIIFQDFFVLKGWYIGNPLELYSIVARFESRSRHRLTSPGKFRDGTSIRPPPLPSKFFLSHHSRLYSFGGSGKLLLGSPAQSFFYFSCRAGPMAIFFLSQGSESRAAADAGSVVKRPNEKRLTCRLILCASLKVLGGPFISSRAASGIYCKSTFPAGLVCT
jgi:hypothetical protein